MRIVTYTSPPKVETASVNALGKGMSTARAIAS